MKAFILVAAIIALSATIALHRPVPPVAPEPTSTAQGFTRVVARAESKADFGAAEQALALHEAKKYSEATRFWRNAITVSPDDLRLHISLGVDLARSGNRSMAISELRKAIALRTKPHGYEETPIPTIADQALINKQYTAAFKDLERFIYASDGAWFNMLYFDDQGSTTYLRSAMDLLKRGQFSAANRPLTIALTKSPNLYPAHVLLGDVYLIEGRRREAIAEWEDTLFSFSPDPPGSSRYWPVHWSAIEMLIHYLK